MGDFEKADSEVTLEDLTTDIDSVYYSSEPRDSLGQVLRPKFETYIDQGRTLQDKVERRQHLQAHLQQIDEERRTESTKIAEQTKYIFFYEIAGVLHEDYGPLNPAKILSRQTVLFQKLKGKNPTGIIALSKEEIQKLPENDGSDVWIAKAIKREMFLTGTEIVAKYYFYERMLRERDLDIRTSRLHSIALALPSDESLVKEYVYEIVQGTSTINFEDDEIARHIQNAMAEPMGYLGTLISDLIYTWSFISEDRNKEEAKEEWMKLARRFQDLPMTILHQACNDLGFNIDIDFGEEG